MNRLGYLTLAALLTLGGALAQEGEATHAEQAHGDHAHDGHGDHEGHDHDHDHAHDHHEHGGHPQGAHDHAEHDHEHGEHDHHDHEHHDHHDHDHAEHAHHGDHDEVAGTRLLVADHEDATVAVLDLLSEEVLASFSVPGPGGNVYRSPSGQYGLVVHRDENRVTVVHSGLRLELSLIHI